MCVCIPLATLLSSVLTVSTQSAPTLFWRSTIIIVSSQFTTILNGTDHRWSLFTTALVGSSISEKNGEVWGRFEILYQIGRCHCTRFEFVTRKAVSLHRIDSIVFTKMKIEIVWRISSVFEWRSSSYLQLNRIVRINGAQVQGVSIVHESHTETIIFKFSSYNFISNLVLNYHY